jgi:hypothetical protein
MQVCRRFIFLTTSCWMGLICQIMLGPNLLAKASQLDVANNQFLDQQMKHGSADIQANDTSGESGENFWKNTISLISTHDGYITEEDFEKAFSVKLKHRTADEYGTEASLTRGGDWYTNANYGQHFKNPGSHANLINPRIEYSHLLLSLPNTGAHSNDCVNAESALNDLLHLGWTVIPFSPLKKTEFADANMANLRGKKKGEKISLYYEASTKQPPYIKVNPAAACVNVVEIWGEP